MNLNDGFVRKERLKNIVSNMTITSTKNNKVPIKNMDFSFGKLVNIRSNYERELLALLKKKPIKSAISFPRTGELTLREYIVRKWVHLHRLYFVKMSYIRYHLKDPPITRLRV